MRNRRWILAVAGLIGIAALSGCTEKTQDPGPHTIILELADPEDEPETEEESVSTMDTLESEPETDGQPSESEAAVLSGLSEGIRLEYTHIASDDPVVALATKKLLPDGTTLSDFAVTDIQAYQGDEKVVPAGTVTFTLNVPEENASVLLYHMNDEGQVVEKELPVENGTVSYDAEDCGHWIVLNETVQEPETEVPEEPPAETESGTD